ncbi:adenylate cyclase [Rhizobiales bacterium GAS188]|nr:adenylate cyclase [Rhizobiales bacterium GAS188]
MAPIRDEFEFIDRLLREGLKADDLAVLLKGFSEGLVERGIPLLSTGISMPTIDPTSFFRVSTWWREGRRPPARPVSDRQSLSAYKQSPIYDVLKRDANGGRWKLDDPQLAGRFPLLKELREHGATEYALSLVAFSERRTAMRGTALSMVTDRPGGFEEDEIAAVARLLPALSLAAYRIGLLGMATDTLGAYLGPFTAGKVLQGMIHRGDSRVISAALLLADLRGFTALVDRIGAASAISWLNEHLEAIADPVAEQGGEVLKFLGDGLLAVFPAGEDAGKACRAATLAAKEIRVRTRALNLSRGSSELRSEVVLVLHFGEVVYGNVGAAQRLDFTVIGEAVNEASRMETLGKVLAEHLLLSEPFARRCDERTRSIGHYALRGVSGEREIFVLEEDAASSRSGHQERAAAAHAGGYGEADAGIVGDRIVEARADHAGPAEAGGGAEQIVDGIARARET